jgi:uncharacterized membrane protein YvbJ
MAIISCPECGRQVSDKALKCPQCAYPIANPETRDQLLPPKPLQKEPENIAKKWITLTGTAILVLVAFVAIKNTVGMFSENESSKAFNQILSRQSSTSSSATYSMSDYNQITTGMSYSQVKTILGSNEGKELSRVDITGAPLTVSYQWQNDDGSNIIIMFQDDAVTTKAQALLK